MRFKDRLGQKLPSESLICEYRSAEKLFSARFGKSQLFLPRLFHTDVFDYSAMHSAFLQTEFVECLTSEFPAEYNVYRLFFCAEQQDHPLMLTVDSAVKAERILSKLTAYAPHVEIRPEVRVPSRGSFNAPRH